MLLYGQSVNAISLKFDHDFMYLLSYGLIHSQSAKLLCHHPSLWSPVLEVALAVWVILKVRCAIERRPFRLILEEAHSFDILRFPLAVSPFNINIQRLPTFLLSVVNR